MSTRTSHCTHLGLDLEGPLGPRRSGRCAELQPLPLLALVARDPQSVDQVQPLIRSSILGRAQFTSLFTTLCNRNSCQQDPVNSIRREHTYVSPA